MAACRTARELDKVLDGSGPQQTSIDRAAGELRISSRQVYNLLARYRIDLTVTSLLPRLGGFRKKRLGKETEDIIAQTLQEQWLVLVAMRASLYVATDAG